MKHSYSTGGERQKADETSLIFSLCLTSLENPTQVFLGFNCVSASKESACNAGGLGSIPGLGRSPGEGKGYPTAVFWPGEFHGLYAPWGCKESDTTEQLSLSTTPALLYAQVLL